MGRICGYDDTTTGHPCEQVIKDSSDHCEAGHPSPTSRKQFDAVPADLTVRPSTDEVDEFVLQMSESKKRVESKVRTNKNPDRETTEERLGGRTRTELRAAILTLLGDGLQRSTAEIGWLLFPSVIDRRSSRGAQKARRILRSLEHDGLVNHNGRIWTLATRCPTH